MISSDKLNLKITKMDLQKILDIFEEHGFNENNCSFFRQEDITDIAKEIEEAINYTRCFIYKNKYYQKKNNDFKTIRK